MRECNDWLASADELDEAAPATMGQTGFDCSVVQNLDLWEPAADPEIGIFIWILLKKWTPLVIERPNDFTFELL